MNCPVCDITRMREVEKNGVQIDICPDCKGVWLDRGELEKLMLEVREERESYDSWHQEWQQKQPTYDHSSNYDQRSTYDHHPPHHHKRKKKKNVLDMLGDLFD